MEVAAGTSDAAVIDLLMAGAMVGKGTGYENLTHTVELTTEKYWCWIPQRFRPCRQTERILQDKLQ